MTRRISRLFYLCYKGIREVVDAAFVETLNDAGYPVHVWTINDHDAARHFAELGVASTTTDRPAAIRAALQPRSVPATESRAQPNR